MSTPSLKLYEIANALDAIAAEIIEAEGEIGPDVEARLDAMEGAFDEKVKRVALKVRELEATAKGVQVEADRLAAVVRRNKRAADWLKGYLVEEMQRAGRDVVNADLCKVRVMTAPRPSIRWPGEPDTIPEPYRKVVTSLDGGAAYEDYRAEKLPEGFEVSFTHFARIY
jgi:ATPase subunit of ABC transporter with duplicated ATPase domains